MSLIDMMDHGKEAFGFLEGEHYKVVTGNLMTHAEIQRRAARMQGKCSPGHIMPMPFIVVRTCDFGCGSRVVRSHLQWRLNSGLDVGGF